MNVSQATQRNLMRSIQDVGIVGYGAYIPQYRLPGSEVARVWSDGSAQSPITEKAVAGLDEDVTTMAIEAARNAIIRSGIAPEQLRAVWVGSESHPYAVKPTSTIVAEALGTSPNIQAADWEFACKAGTEAVQASIGLIGSGMGQYTLSIGMDTAQGRPGDPLEYTAASGGAAFLLGPADEAGAVFLASYSYVTDTPDFWRRAGETYPTHADRFTGEPAYFAHTLSAASSLMEEMRSQASDYDHAVFHQPNVKFPSRAGKMLGFVAEQLETGLLADRVGNVYSGSCMLGLTAILDVAKPGARILMVSYGSGAGSDAFDLRVTERIEALQSRANSTEAYIRRRIPIDYATYCRFRGKLKD
ncbi:MAG: hydroxymethylglutaryl-CoA synthase [Chloroflexi bacterium]|nr:hydroxymethylglutaryl-CoA synthase [Chloroflexota bacterium]